MFGIFDLAFPKIVDPTIFVRESFIFAGNSLARRAGAFFSRAIPSLITHNSWMPRSSISFVPARRKEAARGGKKSVARGEESSRGKLPRRGEYGHDTGVQDSRNIKIAKPLCLCKNAKFGPSNAKFAKMHKSNAKL